MRPDHCIDIFCLHEIILIKPRLIRKKTTDGVSPIFGQTLFIFGMSVSDKSLGCFRIEKVYIRKIAVHCLMRAFFHTEHKYFPTERFRMPRLTTMVFIIGNIEKVLIFIDAG